MLQVTELHDNVSVPAEAPGEQPKRKRGRPKGLGKVPGSGRQKATKNWTHPEIRDVLLERSNAIEVLADIVAGRQLQVSGPTGKEYWARPTMQERLRATELLLKKILPDLQATELTGAGGSPLLPEREQDPRQIARAILATLGEAALQPDDDDDSDSAMIPRAAHEYTAERFEPIDPVAALDLSDPGTEPAIGERILCGDVGAWVEKTPDGRWRSMHADGSLGRYCRDRAEAERQAGAFTW